MGTLKEDYNHGTEFSWSTPLAEADFMAAGLANSTLARTLAVDGDEPVVTYHVGQYFYTPIDIETAHNAGMVAIGVSWGFRPAAELQQAGAHHVLEQPMQLMTLP